MALSSFIRLLIVGFICYFLIVLVLRVSGKRTLSKMNAFDFVVTVALGSVLSNILINNETLLMEGIVSFCLLVFLQFLSSWLSVHSPTVNSLLKSQPSLLYYNGNYYYKHMKKERISKNEITQAIRSQGIVSTDSVSAVVLETDGKISVLKKQPDNTDENTLENIDK